MTIVKLSLSKVLMIFMSLFVQPFLFNDFYTFKSTVLTIGLILESLKDKYGNQNTQQIELLAVFAENIHLNLNGKLELLCVYQA